jgi:hypothetical protein
MNGKSVLRQRCGLCLSIPLVLLLVGFLIAVLCAQEGGWTTHTALLTARGEFVAGTVGDRIIACGGLQGLWGTPSDRVEAYNSP